MPRNDLPNPKRSTETSTQNDPPWKPNHFEIERRLREIKARKQIDSEPIDNFRQIDPSRARRCKGCDKRIYIFPCIYCLRKENLYGKRKD